MIVRPARKFVAHKAKAIRKARTPKMGRVEAPPVVVTVHPDGTVTRVGKGTLAYDLAKARQEQAEAVAARQEYFRLRDEEKAAARRQLALAEATRQVA